MFRWFAAAGSHPTTKAMFVGLAVLVGWTPALAQKPSSAGEKMLAIDREVYPQPSDNVASSLDWLGETELDRDNLDAAAKRFQAALDIRTALDGAGHWKTTDARRHLAQARLLATLGEHDRQELREAKQADAQREALDRAGKYAEAASAADKGREIRLRILGAAHPDYADSLSGLANGYYNLGDFGRAEPLDRQAAEILKQALGEVHPEQAIALNNLGNLYVQTGDFTRAETLIKQALEIRRQSLGEKHADFAMSLSSLAALYEAVGQYPRAEPLYRQAVAIHKQALGEEHIDYSTSLNNLAVFYRVQGDYPRAEPLARKVLEISRKINGEAHPNDALCMYNLAVIERALDRPSDAAQHARQAVRITRQVLDATGSVQSERQQLAMVERGRLHLDGYIVSALEAGEAPETIYAEVAAWKGGVSAQQQLVRSRERALASDPNSEFGRLFSQLEQMTRRLAALDRYTPQPDEAEKFQQTSMP